MAPVKLGELELYDVEELSKSLGIQERTVRKLLKDGKLQGRKLARKWYVSSDSLRAYFLQPEEPEARGAG